MRELLGPVLLAVGGLLFAVGAAAERYHSRRLKRHVDRLARLRREDDEEAIPREVESFYGDRRVEIATDLLVAEPIGVVVFMTGAGFILL